MRWSSEQSKSAAGRKESGEDNADRWAWGISGRERECWRGLLGCGRGWAERGKKAGREEELAGPRDWAASGWAEREGTGWTGVWARAGLGKEVWAGFGSSFFSISFVFLNQTLLQPFESK